MIINATYLVGKIGVEAHSRTEVHVSILYIHAVKSSMTYARATGRLVNSPKNKDEMPAMAAVAVIKSLRTSTVV